MAALCISSYLEHLLLCLKTKTKKQKKKPINKQTKNKKTQKKTHRDGEKEWEARKYNKLKMF